MSMAAVFPSTPCKAIGHSAWRVERRSVYEDCRCEFCWIPSDMFDLLPFALICSDCSDLLGVYVVHAVLMTLLGQRRRYAS